MRSQTPLPTSADTGSHATRNPTIDGPGNDTHARSDRPGEPLLATALGARASHRRHIARGGVAAPPGAAERALLLTLGFGALALVVLAIA